MRTVKTCAREIGNGIVNAVVNGSAPDKGYELFVQLWDQIPLAAVASKGRYTVGYKQRLVSLMTQLVRQAHKNLYVRLIDTKLVNSLAEAYAHSSKLMGEGKEGTILKKADAIWRDGTSKEQIKLKLEVDVDLEIEGIAEGRAGTKNEGRPGAFNCKTLCGGLKVDVAIKNEELRDRVEKNSDDFIGKIIAVRANQVLAPSASNELHSLFLPRMVEAGYRIDKAVADSLDQVKAQFASAVGVA